ncbi:MAG: Ig-like domain-containing protein [Spirochaetia bacterium]
MAMSLRCRALWLACTLFLSGCRLVNMEPLEVIAVDPETARIDAAPGIEAVALTLSTRPDRKSVESSFSLSADGVPVAGRFEWHDNTVRFAPYEPIRRGFDYVISLTADAQDSHGNAMLRDFEHEFTTRTISGRPEIVSVLPRNGERIATQGEHIRIEFDRSIDRSSFYEALSISPSIPYAVEWSQERSVATVRPVRSLTAQQEYALTLSTELTDEENRALSRRFEHAVVAGEPAADPRLVSVTASFERAPDSWLEGRQDLPENDARPTLPVYPEGEVAANIEAFSDWETFWDLAVEFDRPVNGADLEAAIEIDPEVTYSLEPDTAESTDAPGYAHRWRIATTERFEYDRRYTLRLEGVVRDERESELELDGFAVFRTNGSSSLPPSMESVRFLVHPAEAGISGPLTDEDELDLTHYSTGTERGTPGFFDLYISLAAGAEIDPFTIVDRFSIVADNLAARFELAGIQSTTTGTIEEFDPQPLGYSPGHASAHEHVLRVWLLIEDTERSGLVRIKVDETFTDTYGNAPAGPWRLRLNQISTP